MFERKLPNSLEILKKTKPLMRGGYALRMLKNIANKILGKNSDKASLDYRGICRTNR